MMSDRHDATVRRKRLGRLTAACACLALTTPAWAEVKLATIFGDGMVVQRDRPVPVWGTATPNGKVTVQFGDQKATANADAKGRFHVALPARPAGGPFTLTADDGHDKATLTDVYSGDVWLCSGQSNMQMSLAEADHGRATAAKAGDHAKLRLCKIGQAWTDTPQTDCKAEWKPASPESAEHFTAVGYFFADALLQSPQLSNVPVGVIESDLGGTLAEAWTPKQELATIEGKPGDSMFGIHPTTLYNGMIAPLGKIGLRGVLWYQGEGNAGDPATYASKLTALIRGWRRQFADPKLPFFLVQLPDYAPSWGGYFWQWTRDAQRAVTFHVENVDTVNAIRTNDGLDLHPKPKQAIGQRAALLVRQTVYGEQIVGHGPRLLSVQPKGDAMRVRFDADGSALAAADPKAVHGFLLAGDDKEFRVATGAIDGDAVLVRSPMVPSPKFVRYAWAGVPDATLTNTDGLPADPFRTDTQYPVAVGVQPQATPHVLVTKRYEITVADGTVKSFTADNRQLLSNETGVSGGVNVPGFLGPTGFGELTELGPDLVRLGNDKFNLEIAMAADRCTWTVHADDNDARTIRMNLSPIVQVADQGGGNVTLTRPGVTVKVSGVDKVDTGGETHFLEFKAPAHATTTITFDFGG